MTYLPREQRRAQIVAAAVDLMTKHGLAAATVRAVSNALGMAQGQIHHHFESADALRAEAFRAFSAQVIADCEKLYADTVGMERVLALLCDTDTATDAHIKRMWKEAVIAAHTESGIREAVSECLHAWHADLTQALHQALVEQKRGATGDVGLVARRLIALKIGGDTLDVFGLPISLTRSGFVAHISTELHGISAPLPHP